MAEIMTEELTKISNSLENLRKIGLPESLVIMYVNRKTKVGVKKIKAIFEAIRDFERQIKRKTEEAE